MSGVDGRRDDERALGWLFGAHAALAGLWVVWQVLESTPGIASASGGTFAGSIPGRAFTFVTILASVASLVTLLALSVPRWRDARVGGLLVALAGALALRKGVDVLDLVYVGLVAMVAVSWFDGRWRRRVAERA